MSTTHLQKLFTLVLVFVLVLSACQTENPASPLSATLKEVSGIVNIKQAGQNDFVKVTGNETLQQNGSVQTGDDGRVRLDLSTGTIIRLSPSSLFTLVSNQQADNGLSTKLKLDVGQLFIILKGGSINVETPSGVASVRGSYLSVEVDSATFDVYVTCLEGDCGASNGSGSVNFGSGEKTILFHCDPATGKCTVPSVGPMSDEDFQKWLDENPEAKDVLNQAYATMTAMAPTEPPATEPPATEAPTEPPATETPSAGGTNGCVNIIGPLDGSELPWQGPVNYAWEGQPDAQKYIVTFHYPNGQNIPIETTDTHLTHYTETMYDAGTYSWDVTVIGKDGTKVCQTHSMSFSKPSSDPGVPPKEGPQCTYDNAQWFYPNQPCFCDENSNQVNPPYCYPPG